MLIVLANGAFFVSARPLARDFDPRKPAWFAGRRRGVRLDLQPDGRRPARARGGGGRRSWPPIRGLYPPRTPRSSPSSATRARTRGFVTRCSTCRSTPSTSCGSATSRRPTTRRRSAMMTPVPATSSCRPASSAWCGSSTTGVPATERPPGLQEIEIPYGRYLYVLPLGRKPMGYAGYTLAGRRRPSGAPPAMTSCVLRAVLASWRLCALFMVARARWPARRVSAGRLVDPSALRSQPGRGRRVRVQPGRPVAGSTAPLWTLLLAAGAAVVGARSAWPRSSASPARSGPRCSPGARRWRGARPPRARWWPASPCLGRADRVGRLSGMEVTLAAPLVAGALLAHARPVLGAVALLGLAITRVPRRAARFPFLRARGLLTLAPGRDLRPRAGRHRGALVALSLRDGRRAATRRRRRPSRGRAHRLARPGCASRSHTLPRPWVFSSSGRSGWRPTSCSRSGCARLVRPGGGAVARSGSGPGPAGHPLAWRCSRPTAGPASRKAATRSTCYRSRSSRRGGGARVYGVGAPRARPGAPLSWPLAVALRWSALAARPSATPGPCRTSRRCRCSSATGSPRTAARGAPRRQRHRRDRLLLAARVVDLMGLVTPEILPYRREGEDGVIRSRAQCCPRLRDRLPDLVPAADRAGGPPGGGSTGFTLARTGGLRRPGMVVYFFFFFFFF